MDVNAAYAAYTAATDENRAHDKDVLIKELKNFSNRVVWRTIREYRPDIVDEAISTLLAQLASFKGTSKFSTWAYSIIERICFRELRTKITIKKHEKSFSDFEDFEIEALLSYEPDTEAKATLDVLRQSLSSEENELIDLKLNGHTSVEIAEKLATTADSRTSH